MTNRTVTKREQDNAGERLAKIETTLDYLKEQQELMNKQNRLEHEEIKVILKDWASSADKKYASKTAEIMIYSLAGLIFIGVIGAILKIVLGL